MTALTGSYPARGTRLRLAPEADYGVLPAQPAWLHLPRTLEAPGPAAVTNVHTPDVPRTAAAYESWSTGPVAGQFACVGRPDAVEPLLDLALERGPGGALSSWTADVWCPDDPRRLAGLVVDTLEWTAGPDGSRATVLARGRSDQPHPGLAAADFAPPGSPVAPYTLRGAALTVAGGTLQGVRRLAVAVRNDVRPGPVDETTTPPGPAWMTPGRRSVTLSLEYYATAGALRALQRAADPFELAAQLSSAAGRMLTLHCPAVRCRSVRRLPGVSGASRYRAALTALPDPATGAAEITWTAGP
jgi:hypothetical protein